MQQRDAINKLPLAAGHSLKPRPIIERSPASQPFHHNPLLARIFANRGLESQSELDYRLTALLSPSLMKGLSEAAEELTHAILANKHILVIGDYDCDGATATSVMVDGLKLLGAKNVSFIVPDRMAHGYGLSPAIAALAEKFDPDVIVTVDNGIASVAGAARIREYKKPCKLIITDHHLPLDSGQLPDADVIINPQQPGCPFPSKAIAGCGVAFYLIMALRAYMRDSGIFAITGQNVPDIRPLLDLVALGTVADVVPLDYNNRLMVSAGLGIIRAGKARPLINALLKVARRDPVSVVSSDMGFALGPRLNAAGRLEDMSLGIKGLLEKDYEKAEICAQQLDMLNAERKSIEAEMVDQAVMEADQQAASMNVMGYCLYNGDWHEGVVGIVASRIKDRVHCPVICFTNTHEANELIRRNASAEEIGEAEVKGSARSVPGFHMKHALDAINASHPQIMTKFGGHAMAAGLSVKIKFFNQFKRLFDEQVKKFLTREMVSGALQVDWRGLPVRYMSLESATSIREAGPWGQHFPEPSFSANFRIDKLTVLKEKHLRLELVHEQDLESQKPFTAIYFNSIRDGVIPIAEGEWVECVFRLDVNLFRGNAYLQIMVETLCPAAKN